MNSRSTQDAILRLLADGPFRSAAITGADSVPAEVKAVLARMDSAALDRFGRFLCRHYYRERVVHYFKYSRALAPVAGRSPEAVLKTPEFTALMPQLILGERTSASRVLELLRRHLTEDADAIRGRIPYWDDLIAYQGAFFLADTRPLERPATLFPTRADTATILELHWDLPAILPELLRPFDPPPTPPEKPTRLLFARSPVGEVTALRCTDALKALLEKLTGEIDPAQVAAQMGLDWASFEKTLGQLERLGAVVAQESFSSSHVGSELPSAAGACG